MPPSPRDSHFFDRLWGALFAWMDREKPATRSPVRRLWHLEQLEEIFAPNCLANPAPLVSGISLMGAAELPTLIQSQTYATSNGYNASGSDPTQLEPPAASVLTDVASLDAVFSGNGISNLSSTDPQTPITAGVIFTTAFNDDPLTTLATIPGDPATPTTPSSTLSASMPTTSSMASVAGQGSGGVVSAYQPSGSSSVPSLGTITSAAITPVTNQQAQAIASQNALPGLVSAPVLGTPISNPTATVTPSTSPLPVVIPTISIPTPPPITNPIVPITPTPPPTSPPTMPPMPPMPPTANNDLFMLNNGGMYTVSAASGVLANDYRSFNQSMSAVLNTGPSHGTLALSPDGSFTLTPNLNFVGNDSFTYHDVAGGLSSNVATVSLYMMDGRPVSFNWIQTPPTAPTFAYVGPHTSAEGDAVNLPILATANGGSLTFAALNLPVGLGINPNTGIISGTVDYAAAENFGGIYTTTIVASNAAGGSSTENFTWTVSDTPRSPVITSIASQSNTAGDTISLQVQATDPDGGILSYDATGLPGGASIDTGTGAITGPIDLSVGSPTAYSVTVTVDNGIATPTSVIFNWTVNPGINLLPTLRSPGDQTNAAGDSVYPALDANDLDGDSVTFTATNLPTSLSLNQATGEITGTAVYSATPAQVTVTASDGQLSVSQSFQWTVTPVSLSNPGDQNNLTGDTVSLALTAQDASGGNVSYSATGLPSGLNIGINTGIISGPIAINAGQNGPYQVTVTATNGSSSTSQSFQWTVMPSVQPAPPVVTAPAAQSNLAGDLVTLQVQASDTAGFTLRYEAVGLPDCFTMDPATGIISGTVTENAVSPTPYTVTVSADDGVGDVTRKAFAWSITGSPVTLTGSGITAAEGKGTGWVTIGTFTTPNLSLDIGAFTATVSWHDNSMGLGMIDLSAEPVDVSGQNGTFTIMGAHTFPSSGRFSPVLTVTQDDGSSVTATVSATITPATGTLTGGFEQGEAVNFGSNGAQVGEYYYSNPATLASAFTVQIDLNDGTGLRGGMMIPQGGGWFAAGLTDIAMKPSARTATVMVTDPHGVMTTATSTVEAGDIEAGLPSTLTMTPFWVNDRLSPASAYTSTITWGDGSSSIGVVSGSGGCFVVTGQHTYAVDSIDAPSSAYVVNVTLSKGDQALLSANHGVVVSRPPMTAQMANVVENADGTVPNQVIATFEVPNSSDGTVEFAATTNWGDGSSSTDTIIGSNGLFHVIGGHVYTSSGDHVVQVNLEQHWLNLAGAVTLVGLLPGAPIPPAPAPPIAKARASSNITFQDGTPLGSLTFTVGNTLKGQEIQGKFAADGLELKDVIDGINRAIKNKSTKIDHFVWYQTFDTNSTVSRSGNFAYPSRQFASTPPGPIYWTESWATILGTGKLLRAGTVYADSPAGGIQQWARTNNTIGPYGSPLSPHLADALP